MKELSIVEKAKRYDEAIKKAEKWHNAPNVDKIPTFGNRIIEDIFPELYESEDEKIRKELIRAFKSFNSIKVWNGIERTNILAWLEKQGEKKPQGKSALEAINEEEVDNANKVEPKFKVGDWIIFNGLTLYINEVVKGYYRTISKGGIPNSYDWDIDNAARLWTLQDAKDGDVLYFSNETIVIFKDLYNEDTFHSYCHIENGTFDVSTDELPDWWDGEDFYPATKEQCDILFAKMKEAGYEWVADKKSLIKL